jgi:glycosyltransferase involved in cell wall biosynthesis
MGEDKSFVIVTASYNNKEWYQKNLNSVLSQTYSQWRMIYVNDNSFDGTGELVADYIVKNNLQNKITLINNPYRRGHLYNQFHAIRGCNPEEIIVILDGDDWLANPDVLSYLNTVYQSPNVWLTYGQFWYFNKNKIGMCKVTPAAVVKNNSFRDYPGWIFSHLRSFYARLFHLIKSKDLIYKGSFFPMAADAAVMYPMLEMAGQRAKFIPEVLYIYNDVNPISFHHDRAEQQKLIKHEICHNRPRYTALSTLF